MTGAFFEQTDDGLAPAPQARSPWAADMLHGRLLSGLAARAVDAETPADGSLRLARLTVDMFKSPPMAPLQVASTVVREGRRVKAVDVTMAAGGTTVGRASALLLRVGDQPTSAIWRAEEWAVPGPDELPGAGDGLDARGGWEIRMVTPGGFSSATQKRMWTRDCWQLVAGEPLSPMVRAALAADLPNPLANSGADGLLFINADLTMYLRRAPVSEWIGLEVSGHLAEEGIAIGECTMYDVDGAIGWSSVSAVSNPRGIGG